jgi:hypothetical protein
MAEMGIGNPVHATMFLPFSVLILLQHKLDTFREWRTDLIERLFWNFIQAWAIMEGAVTAEMESLRASSASGLPGIYRDAEEQNFAESDEKLRLLEEGETVRGSQTADLIAI